MKLEVIPTEAETLYQAPGLVATATQLIVFDSATDDQLAKGFGKLAKMEGAVGWWFGDLGIAMQTRRQRVLAKEAAALRNRANECTTDADGLEARRRLIEKAERLENFGVIEYTRELCAAYDVSDSYVRQCVMWARFYEPSHRLYGLKVKHHQVAMQAAGGARGNLKTALEWLTAAQTKQLSAAELRKEVNVAKAIDGPAPAAIETTSYAELDAADTWALHNVRSLDAKPYEELVRHWTQLQGLREYLAAVERLMREKAPADLAAIS